MLFVPFKLVLFIHSLSWPARELGWVKYEGSGELYCLCCIVCIASFHSAIVTNLVCLLQVPFYFHRSLEGSKIVSTVGLTS